MSNTNQLPAAVTVSSPNRGDEETRERKTTQMGKEEYTEKFSYEYGVDVKTGDDTWLPIRFISQVDPKTTPQEVDGATYDDKGSAHPITTGEENELTFTTLDHRLKDTGKPLPEISVLAAACLPDARGTKATCVVRYYDKPADPDVKGDPDEAFELTVKVSRTRGENGNQGLAVWNWTLKGTGPRRKIENPANKTSGK